jgi:putative two-component system response regulator
MRNGKALVLAVDDDEGIRQTLHVLLEGLGHDAVVAESGEAALDFLEGELPDLILLDVEMTGISGFDVVKKLKQDARTQSIPVIMVTGLGDRESRLRALQNGAEDYLMKPVDPTELRMRVRNHLRLKEAADRLADLNLALEGRVREKTAELLESHHQAIFLLTSAAEFRDETTGAHVRRISTLACALARVMGLNAEFQDAIYYASPMHDIGKIGIPDRILLKPGPLTADEWEVMKTHAALGKSILQGGTSPYIRMGALIAETHHERWDGTGYPQGLKADEIPLPGRILLLCDNYDALRSKRPYKPALDHREVTRIITEGDGRTLPGHFFPGVLDAFRRCKGEFDDIFSEAESSSPAGAR